MSLEPGNHYLVYPSIRKAVHSRCNQCLAELTYWVQKEYVEDIKKKKEKRRAKTREETEEVQSV